MIAAESKERYVAAFKQWQSNGNANAPAWLKELRRAGIASFAAQGFPTTKNEDWKYTNVGPIASLPFAQVNGAATGIDAAEVIELGFADPACPRLVFVNGAWAREMSSVRDLPQGVGLGSLADLVKRDDPLLPAQLGHHASYKTQAFVALNTAFMGDGAVVVIPPGCHLAQPIYLIYASSGGAGQLVSQPRTLIFRGARLTAHAVTLSGSLVRNNVHVALNGEGAECVLNGLYLADDKQHIDNFTEIDHLKPHATSFELYKGILDGAAHGVFNGKIVVHKDAQKSNARQVNKNLLLSANAVVNTKPQLEIYADDVKCSHGSTIGQLDDDALFYLRSRGLGRDEARSLLSFAFAGDVVARIKIDSLRRQLDDY